MKYKKILSIFLSTLVVSVSFMNMESVEATPQKGDILIQSIYGPNEGIFSDRDGLWQPGMEKINKFVVINKSDSDIEFKKLSIGNKVVEDTAGYREFMEHSNISLLDNGKVLYKGSIKDTFDNGNIKLDEYIVVKAGEEKVLEMAIETLGSMSNIANVANISNENTEMKIELGFGLEITYQLSDTEQKPEPDPTPTPNPNPDTNTNPEQIPDKKPNQGNGSTSNNLPETGAIIGNLAKSSVGIILLLAGSLMIKRPRKKGDEYSD